MRNSSKNRRGDPRDIEQPLLQGDILHVRETDIKSASERDEDEVRGFRHASVSQANSEACDSGYETRLSICRNSLA